MNYNEIEHGWDVHDVDGEKVGDVREVTDSYLVTEKGFLFPTERYIPRSAITRIEHDRVYLNVRKADIDSQGWDKEPAAAEPAMRGEGKRVEGEGERVQLREEELRARKEPVEAGEVGVRKEVVEEQRTMEVPVTREEVTVQRRPTERRPADQPVGEDEKFRMPVREEQVSVEKQPVVSEEVEIGKRQVQDTKEVGGKVRREEAQVEREGDVDLEGGQPRR
jgi:uncharacterized protein (TIGR02271 family)